MTTLLQDHGGSELRKIVRHAQRLAAMNHILNEYLPENCRTHCQVGQATATEWTILVDGAAWLMNLRYCKPQLLQQLKQHPQCAYLRDLNFRVCPPQNQQKTSVIPTIRIISATNKELLQDLAETVSSPLLKRALTKLSS